MSGVICRPESLDLDRSSWAIGEDAFAEVVSTFSSIQPKVILEFGSGVSTVRLALEFPETKIFSVEGDPQFSQQTRQLLAEAKVDDRVVVIESRISWRFVGCSLCCSYEDIDLPSLVDAVLIDGPPRRFHRGREAVLFSILSKIRTGGIIILDDYNRADERRAVKVCHSAYPSSLTTRTVNKGHGLCVLTKIREEEPRKLRAAMTWGNIRSWLQLGHLIRRRIVGISKD